MKPFQFYKHLKSVRIALFLVAVTFIASLQFCKTAYVPNALNVPLLQEKDELKFLVSPSNTLRGGYKFAKIQAQFGLSLKLSSAVILYNEAPASLGLVIDIAKWYNK